jgi:3-hydroxypropionyl-CoA synthetase (ADP-forming)
LKKKPILVGAMGGPFTRKIGSEIESKNIPVYDFVSTWSTAAGSLAKWQLVRST